MVNDFTWCKTDISSHATRAKTTVTGVVTNKTDPSPLEREAMEGLIRLAKERAQLEMLLTNILISFLVSKQKKHTSILDEVGAGLTEYSAKTVELTKAMNKEYNELFPNCVISEEGVSSVKVADQVKYINQTDLADKCASLVSDCTPTQMEEFIINIEFWAKPCLNPNWEKQIVMELWNRFDQDWKDFLEEFNFKTISFQDLKEHMDNVKWKLFPDYG